MKPRSYLLPTLVVAWFGKGASAQITVTEPVPTNVAVDAERVAPYRIARTIYGSFLEPIGNSIYNGLWAEILQNPS